MFRLGACVKAMQNVRAFFSWAFGGFSRMTATALATGFFVLALGMTPGAFVEGVLGDPPGWLFGWQGRMTLIVVGLGAILASWHWRKPFTLPKAIIYRPEMEIGEIACLATGKEPTLSLASGIELQLYRLLKAAANEGRLKMASTEGRGNFDEQSCTTEDYLSEFLQQHPKSPDQLHTFLRSWKENPQPRHFVMEINAKLASTSVLRTPTVTVAYPNSLSRAINIEFEPAEPFLRRRVFPSGNARYEAYVKVTNCGDGFLTECVTSLIDVSPKPEKNPYTILTPLSTLAKGEHKYVLVAGFNETAFAGQQIYDELVAFEFASGDSFNGAFTTLLPPSADAPAYLTIEVKALECQPQTKQLKLWVGENRRLLMAEV